jgi:hypothetical protein
MSLVFEGEARGRLFDVRDEVKDERDSLEDHDKDFDELAFTSLRRRDGAGALADDWVLHDGSKLYGAGGADAGEHGAAIADDAGAVGYAGLY